MVTSAGLLYFPACEQAELPVYDHTANIYFDFTNPETGNYVDSITYTFAYDMTKATDTIELPVRLSGIRTAYDRYYSAYIEQDSTSAIAGQHFEPLAERYLLPANTGLALLPLVINNTADLEESTYSIMVKLQASDDFGIENPKLLRAKIIFSARLEKPEWWDMWPLAPYSRTKHQLFILVTEQTSLTTVGLDAPRNLYFSTLLTMMLNNPFAWVQNNPAKGYVLEPASAGTNPDYHFYHRDNPARQILLKFNAAANRHYFIDENGQEIR